MHLCTKNGQSIHKKNPKYALKHFTNKCMISNKIMIYLRPSHVVMLARCRQQKY